MLCFTQIEWDSFLFLKHLTLLLTLCIIQILLLLFIQALALLAFNKVHLDTKLISLFFINNKLSTYAGFYFLSMA